MNPWSQYQISRSGVATTEATEAAASPGKISGSAWAQLGTQTLLII